MLSFLKNWVKPIIVKYHSSQNDFFLNCKRNMRAGVEQQSIRRVQSCSTTHMCTHARTHEIMLAHLRMGPMLPEGLFGA